MKTATTKVKAAMTKQSELYAELRLLTKEQLADRAGIHEKGWGRQQLIATIIMKEVNDDQISHSRRP